MLRREGEGKEEFRIERMQKQVFGVGNIGGGGSRVDEMSEGEGE